MTFTVLQKGASAGGQTTVHFGATTPGSCLIILAVSNNTAGACTAGGQTLMGAAYTAGHNGDYTGIWFLPGPANPGGITSATVSGSYAVGIPGGVRGRRVPEPARRHLRGRERHPDVDVQLREPGRLSSRFHRVLLRL